MTDNSLLLLAFGVFSTALVLVYLLALWVRPRAAWGTSVVLVVGSIGSFVISEQQVAQDIGSVGATAMPGLRLFILGAVLAIAAVGAVVGAGYGTWRARQR
jgi:hypothetical protein